MEETGAGEILAGLRIETVVGIILALTLLRLALLHVRTASRSGKAPGTHPLARAAAEMVESALVAGALVFLIIRPFFFQAFFIPSESMEPTLLGHDAGLHNNRWHADTAHDYLFVNKLVYRYREPDRGDIIVFRAPKEADQLDRLLGRPQQENVLIKRLIGLPGDTLEVRTDGVYRNNRKLLEPYIKEPMALGLEESFHFGAEGTPIHLGPGQLWVMGDNRNDSYDSRFWGPLDRGRVIGKAALLFWPLSRFRTIR
ncbi:MAG TPA: signal peptidase I [Chthonomonadaceae bacterium]|nr:signal peptidase I [Chthonomonadaceae bacterium]